MFNILEQKHLNLRKTICLVKHFRIHYIIQGIVIFLFLFSK